LNQTYSNDIKAHDKGSEEVKEVIENQPEAPKEANKQVENMEVIEADLDDFEDLD
jgi:hypothetical protein